MITVEYDTTVTKQQIAGILRKANVVRYKKVAGGRGVLRDIKRNYAYYSGVEVIEQATSFNVNPSNLRPRYTKISTGKFNVEFTHGYNGQKFTQEEASQILTQAITALVVNGFIVVAESSRGYIVAKAGN
jgi:hypothetical protein